MNRRTFLATAAALGLATSTFANKFGASLPFETFNSYFVLNTIKPERGKNCKFGVCTTAKQFESLFHPAPLMFTKQKFVKPEYFNEYAILYWIEWGSTPWEYAVKAVKKDDSGLVVTYTRKGEPSETAQFAPILLVGVKKTALAADGKVAFQLIGK